MTRLRVALAAGFVMAAAAFTAGPASAVHGVMPMFDPQHGNAPYLAWRGEELRLVKCVAAEGPEGAALRDGSGALDVDWIVEDWSGAFYQPPALEASTVKFFTGTGQHAGELCVKADFASLKAGLAQIKLVITDARTGDPLLKHQFLAAWLQLNTPTIREVSNATGPNDPPGGGGLLGANAADLPGDPNYIAGGPAGRVQVEVTGTLPLGNNFAELGLGGSITLPNDWPALARRMATTSIPYLVPDDEFDPRMLLYRDQPWRLWDIHDDRSRLEGHVDPVLCGMPAATHTLVDAVDDCDGDADIVEGTYSRVFGDQSAFPTFGPYDPLRADETLLSDGKLDAGDAPMPAARIDFNIAGNTGSPTDLGGVGFFSGALKCAAYTRLNDCRSDSADGVNRDHNFYAPFYGRWQPATAALAGGPDPTSIVAVAEASGNDGPPLGNNFRGYGLFSAFFGFYPYWLIDESLVNASGGDTRCLRLRVGDRPDFYQRPSGIQSAIVYTDEHGEAQINWHPGTGFFFDNLGITPNRNGGCDLRGVDVLGFADISATARYPYQKTTAADVTSAPIRKIVRSLWRKDVVCVPKGTSLEDQLAFICTATAIDITGAPFVGEYVCFMTSAEGMREFPLGTPHQLDGLHRLCLFTDENGQASVEVFGKGPSNVIVEFVDEGIIRFATFTFAQPPTGGTGGTAAGGSTTPPSGSATTGGALPQGAVPGAPAQQVKSIIEQAKQDASPAANAPAAAKAAAAKKARKARLAFARVEMNPLKRTHRYVVVRVNGAAKTAKVQIALVRNGKVVRRVVRTVRTNRVVRVPNLKLPKAIKIARVRVVG